MSFRKFGNSPHQHATQGMCAKCSTLRPMDFGHCSYCGFDTDNYLDLIVHLGLGCLEEMRSDVNMIPKRVEKSYRGVG